MRADLAQEMHTPLAAIDAHLEAVEDGIRPSTGTRWLWSAAPPAGSDDSGVSLNRRDDSQAEVDEAMSAITRLVRS